MVNRLNRKTAGSLQPSSHAPTRVGMEARVAELEEFRRLVESSSLGVALRAQNLHERKRAAEAREEADSAQAHEAARPARVAAFKKFLEQQIYLVKGGATADFALKWSYDAYCNDEKLDEICRLTESELFEGVGAFEGVKRTVVSAGPHERPMPGFSGVEIAEQYRHRFDVASRAERHIETRTAEEVADRRRERLAYENAIYPNPTSPPPAFRGKT